MRAPGLDLLLHTLVDLQLLMNEEQEFISLYFQMQVTALFVAQQKRKSGGGCVAGSVSALPAQRSHGLHLFFTACGDAGSSICGSAAPPVSGFTVPLPPLPPPLSANTPLKKNLCLFIQLPWVVRQHDTCGR